MADQHHIDHEGKTPLKMQEHQHTTQESDIVGESKTQSVASFFSGAPDDRSVRPKKKESLLNKLKNQSPDSRTPPPEASQDTWHKQHARTDLGRSFTEPLVVKRPSSSKQFLSTYHPGSDSRNSVTHAIMPNMALTEERPKVHKSLKHSSKSALDSESQTPTSQVASGLPILQGSQGLPGFQSPDGPMGKMGPPGDQGQLGTEGQKGPRPVLECNPHVANNDDMPGHSKMVSTTGDYEDRSMQQGEDDDFGMFYENDEISLTIEVQPKEKSGAITRWRVDEKCCFVDLLNWTFIHEKMQKNVNQHMPCKANFQSDKRNKSILQLEHCLEKSEAKQLGCNFIWDCLTTYSPKLVYIALAGIDEKLDTSPHFIQCFKKDYTFIVGMLDHAFKIAPLLGKRVVTVLCHFPKVLHKLNDTCFDGLRYLICDEPLMKCIIRGTINEVLHKINPIISLQKDLVILECNFDNDIKQHLVRLDIEGDLDIIFKAANLHCVSEITHNKLNVYGFDNDSVSKSCDLVPRNVIMRSKSLPTPCDGSYCKRVLLEHKLKSGNKYVSYVNGNTIVAVGLASAIDNDFNGDTDMPLKKEETCIGTENVTARRSDPLEHLPVVGSSDNPDKDIDRRGESFARRDFGADSVDAVKNRSSSKQKPETIRVWKMESKKLVLNMNRVDNIDTGFVLTCPYTSERAEIVYREKEDGPSFIVPIPEAKKSSMKELLKIYRSLFDECKKEHLDKIALSIEEMNQWPFSDFSKVVIKASLETLEQRNIDSQPIEVILCTDNRKKFESAIKTIDALLNDKGCPTQIDVISGHIERTEADVIVNSTSRYLELKRGKVSKALLDAAGPQMQKECRNKYPNGFAPGEFAYTNGYKLKCQYVLHIALDVFNSDTSSDCLKNVKRLILKCLRWANDNQMKSIAFPALGTGKLKYPPDFVCNAMFDSVKAFKKMVNESMKDASLLTVKLIVHPNDQEILMFYRSLAETPVDAREKLLKHGDVKNDMPSGLNANNPYLIDIPKDTFSAMQQLFVDEWAKINSCGVVCSYDINDEKLRLTGAASPLENAARTIRQIILHLQSMKFQRFSGKSSVFKEYDLFSNWKGVLCYVNRFNNLIDVYAETSDLMDRIVSLVENPRHVKESIPVERSERDGKLSKDELEHRIILQPSKEVHSNRSSKSQNRSNEGLAITNQDGTDKHTEENELLKGTDNVCNNALDSDSETDVLKEQESSVNVRQTTSNSTVQEHYEEQTNDVASTETCMNVSYGNPSNVPKNDVEDYFLINGIRVKICHGDILEANADCIVNCANSNLQHKGGIARVISEAAGKTISDESDAILKKCGHITTGDVVMTSGGNLQYSILHAVGPCWDDYDRSNVSGIKKCAADLKRAVLNSLKKADEIGCTTIAIPSISSGLFGVPEELCAVQYANAVLKFRGGEHLKEILFVDTNPEMTKLIRSTFEILGKQKKKIDSNFSIFVQKPTKAEQGMDVAKTLENSPIYKGFVSAAVGLKIHFGDITRLIGVQMIVCSENTAGTNSGSIARQLFDMGGDSYRQMKTQAFRKRQGTSRMVEMVITDGGNLCYEKVMHVIIPKDQMPTMNDVYSRIFNETMQLRVFSVAVPLLGIAQRGISVEESITALLRALKRLRTNVHQCSLDVHVVIHDQGTASAICSIVDNFVSDLWGSSSEDGHEVYGRQRASTARDSRKEKSTGGGLARNQNGSKATAAESQAVADSAKSPLVQLKEKFVDKTSGVRSVVDNLVSGLWKSKSEDSPEVSERKRESAEYDIRKDNCTGGGLASINNDSDTATSKSQTTADNAKSTLVKTEDKPDDCVICMDVPSNPKKLKCGHAFCSDCIESLFKIKPSCPICGKACGIICGDQPNGSMIIEKQSSGLTGFEKHESISMCYRFPDSRQGPNHPKPGTFVRGITRIGYLPDNNEGKLVCAMLAVAFQRRLVFTIGSSRTTGEEGVITWNDIHHKTDLRPNTQFGYPDPTYLQRVREELAAKGVTEEDVKSLDKPIAKFIKKGKHGAKAIVQTQK